MKRMRRLHKKRKLRMMALLVLLVLAIETLSGCETTSGYAKNMSLDSNEAVNLLIAGRVSDFPAMEMMTQKFTETYPNCTVEYEYLQDYDETLPLRLVSNENRVDLFITPNIQAGSAYLDSALDLLQYPEQLNLSDTFPGLVENFKYVENSTTTHLYAIPMGGEVRGLYVNLTLLDSLGIEVPANRTELLAACTKLRDAGYIAIQDNPGGFGQRLVFPYIAHLIADGENAEVNRNLVATCDPAAAELFRDPIEFLYHLNVENFYNYKYCEEESGRFMDLTDAGMARSFLNIIGEEGDYRKADDIGEVAFMTSANTLKPAIDQAIEDYHSEIEYKFILAPVSDEGGYAYMSPSSGIAINKDTEHLDWALEFLNFFFCETNNKEFAEVYNVTPNTTDALELISKAYNIPVDEINQPADVTFDYNFYNMINPVLINVSKANNPKYMLDDGNGNVTMYEFDYYMEQLRTALEEQKATLEGVN